MHFEDYELAENCWQELKEGRSKRLTADEVQKIAHRMARATDTVQRSSRGSVDNAREDAWLATCALASEMATQSGGADGAWEVAIARAHEWFKAAE